MPRKPIDKVTLFAIDPDDGTLEYTTLSLQSGDLRRIVDNYQKHNAYYRNLNSITKTNLLNQKFNLKHMTFKEVDYYIIDTLMGAHSIDELNDLEFHDLETNFNLKQFKNESDIFNPLNNSKIKAHLNDATIEQIKQLKIKDD